MLGSIATRIFIALIVLGCLGIALVVMPVLLGGAVVGAVVLVGLFIWGLFFAKRL